MRAGVEVATLGGGCFWCLEPVFEALAGVQNVVVGYAGGSTANPSYRQVGTGSTGHAEGVQIEFDPSQISYREILEAFFAVHDPTTPNRQGADVGPQYRSLILYHTPEQKENAETVIRDLKAEGVRVGTQVEPFTAYYMAEDYHQDYFDKNPYAGYCRVVIEPKLVKFRERYANKLKAQASPAG